MGKPKQTILELNGKRYDARTGQLIAAPAAAKAHPSHPIREVTRATHGGSHQVHKAAQRSQTLMRSGLKRPAASPKVSTPAAKAKPLTDINASHRPAVKIQSHDTERERRSQQVQRSKLVRKFSDFGTTPTQIQAQAVGPTPTIAVLPVQPVPTLTAHKPLKLKESLIEKSLQRATSHTATHTAKPAKKTRKKRSRLATYSAGALATLLLVGFIAYQNVPNIAMRYAAARSGITAGIPEYQPAGFALNRRIQYNPGQITLSYSSNTDQRAFTITQRESNWNSETLKTAYVETKSDQVQTYEDKGRTIYLYGDANATWVSSGVWYDINGNSQLNSDQLIRIATSM